MKKFLSSVLFVLMMLAGQSAFAVPAYPKAITVLQADGTEITIQKHGDEFFNWTTTSDDYLIVENEGVYYYAQFSGSELLPTKMKANDPSRRTAQESSFLMLRTKGVPEAYVTARRMQTKSNISPAAIGLDSGFPTKGEIRSLAILVNFSDVSFQSSTANSDYYALLNEPGYSNNGATGSAKDYYEAVSNGQFKPTFDVYGPYTVSQTQEYYGKNGHYGDLHAQDLIIEACNLADKDVDFSQYDYNDDGMVDNVFVYYAGVNEAEGGPAYTIWPHRFELWEGDCRVDGKDVRVYACTSELNHASRMCGIGTFCHEFGHVLSWADHYDTNNEQWGMTDGVYEFDLMCSGAYLNDGRTPPVATALERAMIDWMEYDVIHDGGLYELESLEKSNKAYIIPTENEGEYYVMENRQQEGWDKYAPAHGLLVFHVDRSNNIFRGKKAIDHWNDNTPNADKDHMCYKILPGVPTATSYSHQAYMTFPGRGEATEINRNNEKTRFVDWAQNVMPYDIMNIKEENGIITFVAITPYGDPTPINSIEIYGRESVIMGDTVQLKSIIKPEIASYKRLDWSSSNEDIATVDEMGVVTSKALGEVTITASSNEKDGVVSDTFTLNVVEGQLLRCQVMNPSGTNGAKELNFKMAAEGGKSYEFTTDENGTFSAEVEPGTYVVTMENNSFPAQQQLLTVAKGFTKATMKAYTKSILKKGNLNLNLEATAIANNVYVSWEKRKTDHWVIKWYEEEKPEDMQMQLVDKTSFSIDNAEIGKTYVFMIAEFDGTAETGFDIQSATSEEIGTDFPVMILKSTYSRKDNIMLYVVNTPSDAEISWKVDDKDAKDIKVKLPAGEHKIQVAIKTAEGTEYITKYIKVE